MIDRLTWKTLLVNVAPWCWYCGWGLDSRTATIDHLHPTSAGGTDSPDNLRLCCAVCNRIKADRQLADITVRITRGAGVQRCRQHAGE